MQKPASTKSSVSLRMKLIQAHSDQNRCYLNQEKNSLAEAHFGSFSMHKGRIILFVHVEVYLFLFYPFCGQTVEFTALIKAL